MRHVNPTIHFRRVSFQRSRPCTRNANQSARHSQLCGRRFRFFKDCWKKRRRGREEKNSSSFLLHSDSGWKVRWNRGKNFLFARETCPTETNRISSILSNVLPSDKNKLARITGIESWYFRDPECAGNVIRLKIVILTNLTSPIRDFRRVNSVTYDREMQRAMVGASSTVDWFRESNRMLDTRASGILCVLLRIRLYSVRRVSGTAAL